jgi:hypothetical protein
MWVLGFVFSMILAAAEHKPKLGIVDLKTDSQLPDSKEDLLRDLRQEFQWQGVFELTNHEQLLKLQNRIDPRELEQRQRRLQESEEWEIFKRQLQGARQLYAESRFAESLSLLDSALLVLFKSGLAVEPAVVGDFLVYKAANEFFLSNQESARESLIWRNFLTDSRSIDTQKFSPLFIAFDNKVKMEAPRLRLYSVDLSAPGAVVFFLGKRLGVSSTEQQSFGVELPSSMTFFSLAPIFFLKDGYLPKSVEAAKLSGKIDLEPYDTSEKVEDDLFQVLGSLAPSTALTDFLKERDLEAVLLINAAVNLKNEWIVRSQIFRLRNFQKSPVVEVIGKDRSEVAKTLVRRLLLFVDEAGNIIEPTGLDLRERAYVSQPLYKKWWFWALVGTGVAGATTAGYFLLKPEEQIKFSVRAKGD